MAKILILTGNSLSHNPRVQKEATALTLAGHSVEVLGAWVDPVMKSMDKTLLLGLNFKFTPVFDFTSDAHALFVCRLLRRIACSIYHYLGLQSHWQLGCTPTALRRIVRRRQADLLIAHSESALWVLSNLHRKNSDSPRVGVDMEDWFSEDLLPEARRERPIKMLRELEKRALRSSTHLSCPSIAMSSALAAEFGCQAPAVIYNAFLWSDRQKLDGESIDRKNLEIPSIHWYSQTLGPGRGLEELVAALPYIEAKVEVHLRGQSAAGFQDWLISRLPENWHSRVFIHNLVSNEELLSRIAEHDIGFAGEMKSCRSRDLTVTNKILHYLLGGLAVVASDTSGQNEIAAQAGGAVRLYRSGDPLALARALNLLLTSPAELKIAKSAALAAAEQTFCWERQVPGLLRSVENALAQ